MASRSLWGDKRPDSYAAIHRGPENYRKVGGFFGEVYVGQDKRTGAVYVAAESPLDLPSPLPKEEVA